MYAPQEIFLAGKYDVQEQRMKCIIDNNYEGILHSSSSASSATLLFFPRPRDEEGFGFFEADAFLEAGRWQTVSISKTGRS
jgi:hypothetical protein